VVTLAGTNFTLADPQTRDFADDPGGSTSGVPIDWEELPPAPIPVPPHTGQEGVDRDSAPQLAHERKPVARLDRGSALPRVLAGGS
jgi:hypothetical protein